MLQEHGEVHLSGLGVAVASLVTIAELLKTRGFAVEKRISTMLENFEDDRGKRQKPKMEVVLGKSPEFDALMAEEAERAKAREKAAAPTTES